MITYCDSALAPANPDVLEYLLFGFAIARRLGSGVLVLWMPMDGIPRYKSCAMSSFWISLLHSTVQHNPMTGTMTVLGIPAHQATDAAPSDDDGIPDGGYGLAFAGQYTF